MNRTNLRKWAARTAIAVAGLATSWATAENHHWGQAQTVMAITVVLAAVTSFLVPADPDIKQSLDTTGTRAKQ